MAKRRREDYIVRRALRDNTPVVNTPIGTGMRLPNHSGDHSKGIVNTTPVNDTDLVNKKYVDDASGSSVTPSSTTTFTNKTINSFTNDIHADDVHQEVRNVSGATLTKGTPVYITGYNAGQDLPTVDAADASASSTMPCVGICNEDISNNTNGEMLEIGLIANIDTSSFTAGDILYVSETTGTLTNTKPQGTALVQEVAVVLRSHASLGRIEVLGVGHYEGLPNLANTKLWIGDTNGVPQEFALSGGATMTAGGVVTLVGIDATGVDTNYIPTVIYNTDATPPTASSHPIGTLYVQYTA